MKLKSFLSTALLLSIFLATVTSLYGKKRSSLKNIKWKVSPLIHATNLSRLPPSETTNIAAGLDCLRLHKKPTKLPFTWWRNTEDECWIAVNPKNPDNMIIGTHQDRFQSFLADIFVYTLDGGKTWNESELVLSRCQGATVSAANDDFEAASDPFITFDNEGNAYATSPSFNLDNNFEEANVVAKSTDGGQSWTRIVAAVRDDGNSHFEDFPRIFADPFRKNTLYMTFDDDLCQLGIPGAHDQIMFQRSTDAGATWETPVLIEEVIANKKCNPNPLSNYLEVLPDKGHTLVITSLLTGTPPRTGNKTPFSAYRSQNDGKTWKKFTINNDTRFQLARDPESGAVVGLQATIHDLAQNTKNGTLYVAWPDPRFNPTGEIGVVVARSTDGGKTWSEPRPANPGTLDVQTFLPSIAVAKDGIVAVLFYDFRFFKPGDKSLKTDVWVSFFDEKLNFLSQVRLTPRSFDSRQFMHRVTDDPFLFIADYVKIASRGEDFVAAFTISNPPYGVGPAPLIGGEFKLDPRNRQDVVFTKICRKS